MGTEKFCLKWNDFESNISHAFREIRDEKDFFDVTLACDDDQLQAHKVILSACSPFFRKVLKRNPHQHPLLYLKGVKYSDLQSVLNFMYHGEVNVAQDELNSFLAVAEELRVKGLTQNNGSSSQNAKSTAAPSAPKSPLPSKSTSSHRDSSASSGAPPSKRSRPNPPTSSAGGGSSSAPASSHDDDDDIQEVVPVKSEPRDIVAPNTVIANTPADIQQQSVYGAGGGQQNSSGQQQQSLALAEEDDMSYGQDESYDDYGQYGDQSGYDGQLIDPSMTAGADGNKGVNCFDDLLQFVVREPSGQTGYRCSICQQFSHKWKDNVKNHVEAKHFNGAFVHTCNVCGDNNFTTKYSLQQHRSRVHRNKPHGTSSSRYSSQQREPHYADSDYYLHD